MTHLLKTLYITSFILASFSATNAQKTLSPADKLIDATLNSYHRDSEKTIYPRILDSLQRVSDNLRDVRASEYLQLVKSQHLFETAKSLAAKDKSLNQLHKTFNESEFAEIKGFYYILRGQFAFGEKEFAESLPYYLQAKKNLEEADYDNLPYATYFYNHFFDVYYYFEDFRTAAEFCEKALKKPDLDLYSHYGYYNNLGLCYIKLKEYKKAEVAFKNGIIASKKRNYKNFEALVLGNLGNLHRLQGRYKEALPLLYADAKTNEKFIPENAAISRLYIAQCLMMTDSMDKAKQFIAPPKFKMPVWSYPNYDLMKYETLAMYYDKVGNFKLGGIYKDSLIGLKETLKVRLDSKKLIVMESNLKIENERKAFASKSLIRNSFLTILLVFFGVVIYLLNNKRKQNQLKLTDSLEKAKIEMESYLQVIKEKNEQIERISLELEKSKEEKSTIEIDEKNSYLAELNQSVILTKDDWDEFKLLFEQLYPNFFKDISQKYPDLTSSEIRLLALEKLNLSSKVMGNMLGILPASIRKTRYRLRRKYPDLVSPSEIADENEF